MRYTHFEIKNFKGIRKLKLELPSASEFQVLTLVSLNECGKTTILEAIDYFSQGNEALDPKDIAGRIKPDVHDLIPIARRANFNDPIQISAGVQLDDSDMRALTDHMLKKHKFALIEPRSNFDVTDVYKFTHSTHGTFKVHWDNDLRGRPIRGSIVRQLFTSKPAIWHDCIEFLQESMPPIWYFPNFLFEFPRRIYLAEQENESGKAKFYRALLQDILYAVDSTASIDEHLLQRAVSGSKPNLNAMHQLLLEMGRRITTDVFTAWHQMFSRKVQKTVRLNIYEDDGEWYVEFLIEDADGLFSIHERSLGFRWFFVFLLLTRYRGSRKDSSPNLVFLLDEPASNLHSTAQAHLLDCLEHLATNSTVIYTTHSNHLINPKWLETTYVVLNKGVDVGGDVTDEHGGKTDIVIDRYRNFASQHPDKRYYFQPILDVLDYSPSSLEMVPDVIMVEGKNDFYTFRYLHDIILNLKFEINFLPGNGSGSLDSIIALYMGWARNFVVLLDSDHEGRKQKKRYIDKFGPIIRDRIMILADLDETLAGKSLEDALERTDRETIQRISGPGGRYTKKKFSRAVQEALAARTKVTLTEPTLIRFSKMFTELDARLQQVR